MKKNINEMFKDWGKENQKLPKGNLTIKNEVLSKIPFSIENYRAGTQKKKNLPWFSIAFAVIAIIVFVGNVNFSGSKKNFGNTLGSFGISEIGGSVDSGANLNKDAALSAPSYESSKNTQTDSFYYPNQDQNIISSTDTREFLKTNYNATIQTRNVDDMVVKTINNVRIFGGRIDGSNSSEEYGFVSFSVPVSKFEMFRREIKDLTNARLFGEETNSTNLLPQKQEIEKSEDQTNNYISSFKNEKAQILKNNSGIVSSLNSRSDGLNRESNLLQAEWQTASYSRQLEITARLVQIQGEKNAINGELINENKIYQNKLTTINQKIKDASETLQSYQVQDQNLADDVSMVSGTISFNWVSIWKLINLFVPGTIFPWILGIAALVSYWRHQISMREFI